MAVGPPLRRVDRAARLLELEAAQQRGDPRRDAAGAPVGHDDLAAGLADAHHLVGRVVVQRRGGRAEGRHDAVEAVVLERSASASPSTHSTSTPASRGAPARGLEELGGDVERRRRRRPLAAAAIATLPVPVATSSTRMPASMPTAPRDRAAHVPGELGDRVVVAGRPERPVAVLRVRQIAAHRVAPRRLPPRATLPARRRGPLPRGSRAVGPGRGAVALEEPRRAAVLLGLGRLGGVALAADALPRRLVELVLAAVLPARGDGGRVAARLALRRSPPGAGRARRRPRAGCRDRCRAP